MSKKKNVLRLLVALVACCVAVVGCQRGPYPALKHGISLEETDTLVLLDKGLQKTISVDSQRAGYASDGRLTAEANVRNLCDSNQSIQVQTVFKDDSNFSSSDESAWQTIILSPFAMQTYSVTSMNASSSRYTIRIRFER